jgi:tetratricopeptide (TPR) repeat protein
VIGRSFVVVGLLAGLAASGKAQAVNGAVGELGVNAAADDKAIPIDLSSPVFYNSRGLAWKKEKGYDKAIADFNEAIRLDPTYAAAFNNRGLAWKAKKEYDKAIADYDQAILLAPNYAVAYHNRGLAWLSKKEFHRAIDDCNEAIRLDPTYAGAYRTRSMAWASKEEYGKAIADSDEALRLDPNGVDGLALSAWLRATCAEARYRDGKRAVELATKACELSNWKIAMYVGVLAAAYAETGDFDSAIKFGQKAVELDPNEVHHSYRLDVFQDHKPYRQ